MNTATINAAAENAERTTSLSQGGRVFNLFFAPARTFADIRVSKSWWVPFVLTIICSYMLTLSGASKIGFHQLTVNAVTSGTGTIEDMSPEQRETAIRTAETTLKISAFAAPALILLYNVLYALALWAGITGIAGGQADFASIFVVLLYADLIQNIRAIGSVFVLFFGGDPNSFNLQNAFGSNPGWYVGNDVAPWLRTLLEAMDVVTVWYLLIIALGCAIVGKVSRASSASVVFGLWLFVVLVRVSWTALN